MSGLAVPAPLVKWREVTVGINLSHTLSTLFATLRSRESSNLGQGLPPQVMECAIERVIQGTEAKVRLIPSYKKRLWNAVARSLEYTDELTDRLPEALSINKKSFSTDPYLNAFFVNAREMQEAVHHSSEVLDYYTDLGNRKTSCYALLCMQKIERNILGSELIDGKVVKDIPQTTVSFTDHRIYSPSPSESQTRLDLRCCFFEGLITNALANIMESRAQRRHLEIEQQKLHVRLRADLSHLEQVNLRRDLDHIEKQLHDLGFVSPEVCLERILDVFSSPDRFVELNPVSMDVDRVGIKVTDTNTRRRANHLELTEATINKQKPRVVVLAKLKQEDWLH